MEMGVFDGYGYWSSRIILLWVLKWTQERQDILYFCIVLMKDACILRL